MTEENKADIQAVLPAETKQPETGEQDPLKTELEKVQRKSRTKVEKLQYSKKRIDEQLKDLGIDDELEENEDDKPVTLGMLKQLQAQTATKTALDLANEVSNETERELLKYHLENTIRSTGNAQEDFRLAQSLVNAVKNQQITEEVLRKTQPKTHTTSSGAPLKQEQPSEELTPDEVAYTRAPWNMTKQQILDARKGIGSKFDKK